MGMNRHHHPYRPSRLMKLFLTRTNDSTKRFLTRTNDSTLWRQLHYHSKNQSRQKKNIHHRHRHRHRHHHRHQNCIKELEIATLLKAEWKMPREIVRCRHPPRGNHRQPIQVLLVTMRHRQKEENWEDLVATDNSGIYSDNNYVYYSPFKYHKTEVKLSLLLLRLLRLIIIIIVIVCPLLLMLSSSSSSWHRNAASWVLLPSSVISIPSSSAAAAVVS